MPANIISDNIIVPVNLPDDTIIKVIGVGGGGCNAAAHMFRQGIHDVSFLVCNTDRKHLEDSPIGNKLQLGPGLGAGGRPEVARKLAEDSVEAIDNALGETTKMIFITAGMGGGTGTGASPVIAREARKRGILTVGIVTIPFLYEGFKQIDKALDGVERLADEVDSLLVINNQRLLEIYPHLSVMDGFKKADDTLLVAAKSIVEIITMSGTMNLDFEDVRMVLEDSGVAIISTGQSSGEGRLSKAIAEAVKSPLLNHNDIYHSTRFLMNISFNPKLGNGLMMEELSEVEAFMNSFSKEIETKWGLEENEELPEEIKVTILASGFGVYGNRERVEPIENVPDLDREEQREVRRYRFYQDINSKPRKRRRHIFLYDMDDLENEELAKLIDDSVTNERSRQDLQDIIMVSRKEKAFELDINNELPLMNSDVPMEITNGVDL